jgi:formate hydrogenlyase subunit 4
VDFINLEAEVNMHCTLGIHIPLMLVLSPLLFGIINRTKAFFAGRRGQPLLQTYYDLFKLFNKGVVYSRTTSWVFRAAPVIGFAAVFTASLLVPFGGRPAVISFSGDFVLFAYLLGLMRFLTVLGALDTGSSFEGMGASREVLFSAMAEPALLVGLAAVSRLSGSLSLTEMLGKLDTAVWSSSGPILLLIAAAMLVVFLAENARIPVDDPNTHLELTMIHEVMVLDYSGPDFGPIVYGTAIKMWVLGTILIGVLIPAHIGAAWVNVGLAMTGLFGLAVVVGAIESCMARLRMISVPQLLIGALTFSILAFLLELR